MSRHSVAVVIPWRPSPGREGNLAACGRGLRETFGTYEPATLGVAAVDLLLADSGHEPFNRSASRNAGIRETDADVVVVCDADVFVDPDALHAAIKAADDGKLHLPYTACRLLTESGSRAVQMGAPPPRSAASWFTNTQSVGGCVVVSYETWRAVGGWDERFIGWGFEDTAFWAAVDTLFGTVRHDGTIHDLWHPDSREIGSPRYMTSKGLCDRYTAAMGSDPEHRSAMRRLIEERVCASA